MEKKTFKLYLYLQSTEEKDFNIVCKSITFEKTKP